MVAHSIATFGRLDYAVNYAGIEGKLAGISGRAGSSGDDMYDKVLSADFGAIEG